MDTKAMEKLFWELFNADDETTVHKIIQTNPVFLESKNWFPYGGKSQEDRGNFGTFENQQANPIAALVEKITNSIDALLLKKCLELGIEPTSEKAPRSMSEAVHQLYEIKNGDFSEVSPAIRKEIAGDIQILVSGDRTKPSLTIFDNGEGQKPSDFPKTFLSLHRNNKTNIPFVQGKYNMGSTGAVVFCGEHRYQLILSRRASSLTNAESNPFGFTLVRRHPLTEAQEEVYRSSWYEYFTINGDIPYFFGEALNLGLNDNKLFQSGAIIKMYSYELPRGYRSEATLDLWRGLNQFLYSPALPCLISDTRFSKNAKHETKVMMGNRTRIVIDSRDKKDDTISLNIESKEMGQVSIEVTVFKAGVDHKEFIDKKPIIFTVNGQVHGVEGRSFISQKLGFSFLKDHLLIQVDCTRMKTSFRQDLFMANRTTLKESPALEHLLDKLTEFLKSNDKLRKLNERRRQGLIQSSEENNELLKTMMNSIPLDRSLIDLLRKDKGLTLNLPTFDGATKIAKNGDKEKEISSPKNRFPAIFRLKNSSEEVGEKIKAIPLNGKGVFEFETDVENEYLFRPKDRGEFQLQILDYATNNSVGGTAPGEPKKVSDLFDVERTGPTDGTIRVSLAPRDALNVGDEIPLEARLTAPEGDLQAIFHVRIAKPSEKAKEKVKAEDTPPSLPQPVRVFENPENPDLPSWKEWDMTIKDVTHVKLSQRDNQYCVDAIAINMDSGILKSYLSKNRVKSPAALAEVRETYFRSMYFHTLFLSTIIEKLRESEDSMINSDTDTEELVKIIMQNYATFILYNSINPTLLPSD